MMDRMCVRMTAAVALILAVPYLEGCQRKATAEVAVPAAHTTVGRQSREVAGFAELPIRFEPNVGQAPPEVEFTARGTGYLVALGRRGATLGLKGPGSHDEARLRLRPLHANRAPQISAERSLTSVSNFLIGSDPSRWRRGVRNFAAVRYGEIYPGVDWVVYGNARRLEYDFVVAPKADPRRIEVGIEGADSLAVDHNGDLLVRVHGQILRQLRPVAWQSAADGSRQEVESRYALDHRRLAFVLGPYDRSRELVIDPAVFYSTYLGGSDGDGAAGIAVDAAGSAYVAGTTLSSDFPTVAPFQGTNHSLAATYHSNAFVTKFNPSGSALVYSTYLGGSGSDQAAGIAVDAGGNAYVVGRTTSVDFPTMAPFQAMNRASASAAPGNGFVTKLDPTGGALVYSTYLGGSGPARGEATFDQVTAVAVDAAGEAYVVGVTASTDFPTMNPFQATNHTQGSVVGGNAFVTKLNSAGSALVYSTYLGGSFSDGASAIAVDSAGSAYVAGAAGSTNFPTVAAFQAANNAIGVGLTPNNLGHFSTAFLTKLNPQGTGLSYSTYLGGNCEDWARGVAVDGDGNAYVTGATCSLDFPVLNPFQASNHALPSADPFNAFVAKLNAAGSALVYSSYLGGSAEDQASAIAVDAAGNAYVAGFTFSADFPLLSALQPTNNGVANGAADAFASVVNASGNALTFSTYFGGSGSVTAAQAGEIDNANAIAVDGMGNLYMAGATYSSDFPAIAAFQSVNKASTGGTAFVAKIAPVTTTVAGPQVPTTRSGGGGALGWELIGLLAVAWTRALVGIVRMLSLMVGDDPSGQDVGRARGPGGGGQERERERRSDQSADFTACC